MMWESCEACNKITHGDKYFGHSVCRKCWVALQDFMSRETPALIEKFIAERKWATLDER